MSLGSVSGHECRLASCFRCVGQRRQMICHIVQFLSAELQASKYQLIACRDDGCRPGDSTQLNTPVHIQWDIYNPIPNRTDGRILPRLWTLGLTKPQIIDTLLCVCTWVTVIVWSSCYWSVQIPTSVITVGQYCVSGLGALILNNNDITSVTGISQLIRLNTLGESILLLSFNLLADGLF